MVSHFESDFHCLKFPARILLSFCPLVLSLVLSQRWMGVSSSVLAMFAFDFNKYACMHGII